MKTGEYVDECYRIIGRGGKPTVTEVYPLVDHYHFHTDPNNCVGGSLHIVLDDGNVEDGNVDFCIKWASEQGDELGLLLACVLRLCSRTQRSKVSPYTKAHQDWLRGAG